MHTISVYKRNPYYADLVFDRGREYPQRRRMGNYLRAIREQRGVTQDQLAEWAGTTQPQVNRLENGQRKFTVEWAERIAPHLRSTAQELLFGTAPGQRCRIVGYVGADTEGAMLYARSDGLLGTVDLPPGGTPATVGAIVRGVSGGGYAPDGSIVFFEDRKEPVDDTLLGETVIVGLEDDRVLVKRLLRGSGPGMYDLESAVGPMLRDQRVLWSAPITAVVPPRKARELLNVMD